MKKGEPKEVLRKLPKWGVGCVPLSDEWWKCLTQKVGQETQLDEAKSLVSRQWGLRFQQGAVTNDEAARRVFRATQPWLQEWIKRHP